MRVVLERTGGFAAIKQTSSVSSDDLSPDEANKLDGLVQTSGIYDLPAVVRSTQPGGDGFQYKVTVDSDSGAHTVQIDEAAVPASLQPLLHYVKSAPKSDSR